MEGQVGGDGGQRKINGEPSDKKLLMKIVEERSATAEADEANVKAVIATDKTKSGFGGPVVEAKEMVEYSSIGALKVEAQTGSGIMSGMQHEAAGSLSQVNAGHFTVSVLLQGRRWDRARPSAYTPQQR